LSQLRPFMNCTHLQIGTHPLHPSLTNLDGSALSTAGGLLLVSTRLQVTGR